MEWRKSSFSGAGNDCVEVRQDLGGLRDTKNPTGAELLLPTRDLVKLVSAEH